MAEFYIREAQLHDCINQKKFKIPMSIWAIWLLLLVSAVGVCYAMLQSLPVEFENKQPISYPIKGEGIEITGASNRWIEPDESHKVGSSTLFFPQVELSFGSSTNKTFICFFKNDEEKLQGDSVRFEVKDGKVQGENKYAFYCTKGFTDKADFNSYIYREDRFWQIVIQYIDSAGKVQEFTQIPLPPIL